MAITTTTRVAPTDATRLLAIETSPNMSGERAPELGLWSNGDVIVVTHGRQAGPKTEERIATLDMALIKRVQARIAALGPEGPPKEREKHDGAGARSVCFTAQARIDLSRVPRSSERDALLELIASLEVLARSR